jgi:hypothetical protein
LNGGTVTIVQLCWRWLTDCENDIVTQQWTVLFSFRNDISNCSEVVVGAHELGLWACAIILHYQLEPSFPIDQCSLLTRLIVALAPQVSLALTYRFLACVEATIINVQVISSRRYISLRSACDFIVFADSQTLLFLFVQCWPRKSLVFRI